MCARVQATMTVSHIFAQWARYCEVCVFRGYVGCNSSIAARGQCPMTVMDVAGAFRLHTLACSVAMTRKARVWGSPAPFETRRPVLSRSWQDTRRDGGFVKAGPCVPMIRLRGWFRMRAHGCRSSEHCVCPNSSHLCTEQPGLVLFFEKVPFLSVLTNS